MFKRFFKVSITELVRYKIIIEVIYNNILSRDPINTSLLIQVTHITKGLYINWSLNIKSLSHISDY